MAPSISTTGGPGKGVSHARSRAAGRATRASARAFPLVIVAASLACAPEPDPGADESDETETGTEDESAAIFDPEHVVEVELQLDEGDWEELRHQTRDADILMGEDCQAQPFANPFTTFEADLRVDGVWVERVGVRKKGFLGSLDDERPSLKVNLREFVDEQSAHGVTRLTLNNCKQDPAFVRQCLTYELFAAAGIPSPRCNFAHVTVNGVDLGVYAHVEEIKKPFLARHFDDDEGNVYEGTLSDFRDGWTATFEKKTHESDPAMPEIEAVRAVMAGPPEERLEQLAQIVDVDEFLSFWAVETLTSHWDGYAGNTNNFYLYAEPDGGLLTFLPWGVDGVMSVDPPAEPTSVFANGLLAHELYADPTARALYRERLATLLETLWDEPALLAEITRMEALILPFMDAGVAASAAVSIDELRGHVEARASQLEPELAGPAPEWTEPLRNSFCFVENGPVEATFATTFGTVDDGDPFASGTGTVAGTVDGVELVPVQVGAQAGANPDNGGETLAIHVVALLEDGTAFVLFVDLPWEVYAPQSIPLEFTSGWSGAILFDPASEEPERFLGGVSGVLELDSAGTAEGEAIQGTLAGELILFGG